MIRALETMMFDSDVLIWLGHGDSRASGIFESDSNSAVSAITVIELFQGSRSALELKTIQNFIRKPGLRLLPVTEAITCRAIALTEKHSPGDGLQLGDALIAATALEHDETLSTGNVRHYRAIRGMKLKAFRRQSGVH